MNRSIVSVQSVFSNYTANFTFAKNPGRLKSNFKNEVIRKTIHFLIALSPSMAAINKPFTVFLLLFGTLSYTLMEYLRFSGVNIPVFSSIAGLASRPRDNGRFVLAPITLGFGALLALLFYPSSAAAIAIYALAFGDGIASLVGKFLGKCRPVFLNGKSIEGSLACFTAVYISAFLVSGSLNVAFVAAFTATAVEALPLEDYDNLVIPVAVGFAVQFVSVF